MCRQKLYRTYKRIGQRNTRKHCFFLKPDTALTKGDEDFYYPDFSKEVHYECEVVVKIDKTGKNIRFLMQRIIILP